MFCLSGQSNSSQHSNVDNILPDFDTNLSIASKIFRTLQEGTKLDNFLLKNEDIQRKLR